MDAKKNNIVKRSIYYYDLFCTLRKNSKAKDDKEALVNSFAEIQKIYKEFINAKKNGNEELANKLIYDVHYLTDRGDYLYVLVDSIKDFIIKFRIVRCRANALPYINVNGELEKITSKIKGRFDVAEVTHCIIFADRNLMGAEYNPAGARATSLSILLGERNYDVEALKILNKIDEGALNKLQKNRNYKLFTLTIKNSPEIISKLVDRNLLGAAFGDFEFDTYTITIKRKFTKSKTGFIPPFGIEEIRDLIEQNGDQISKFVVDQGLYSKEINLLSDKMMVKKEYEYDEDERILDSDKVYASIVNSASTI